MNHHDHDELRELESLRPRHADALGSAGYDSLADLRRASHGDLTAVDGIGTRLATKLKREVGHEGADGTGARKFSDAELAELLELDALKRRHAAVLRRDGYESVADLGRADHGDLTDISGVGSRVAMKLKGEVGHEDGTADDTGGAGASDDGSSGQSVSAERPGMVTGSTGHDDNRASAAPETVPGRAERPLAYADLQKGERLGSGGNADVYRATASTDEGRVELAVKDPESKGRSTPMPSSGCWRKQRPGRSSTATTTSSMSSTTGASRCPGSRWSGWTAVISGLAPASYRSTRHSGRRWRRPERSAMPTTVAWHISTSSPRTCSSAPSRGPGTCRR
jgi:predicted flap endonuclease-1-like 5' DNA nuclease